MQTNANVHKIRCNPKGWENRPDLKQKRAAKQRTKQRKTARLNKRSFA